MPSISVSAARRRCLISLPWLLLAASGAGQVAQRRQAARAALPEARQRLVAALAREHATRQLVAGQAASPELVHAVAQLLDLIRTGGDRHGVRVGMLSLAGHAVSPADGPADAHSLQQAAQPVPGVTGLRWLQLEVRANYRNYDGLQAWFVELGHLPVSVRHLVLEDSQLQLSLRVLGV